MKKVRTILKKNMYFLPIAAFAALFLLTSLLSCGKDPVSGGNTDDLDTLNTQDSLPPAPEGWELLWYDEFEGDSLDMDKWLHETGGHGWGNYEQQYYTDRPDNAYLQDGKLIIEAKFEDYGGMDYTSARLNSTIGWNNCRVVVRAKLPTGIGTWPAIWFLPDVWNYGTGGWPDNGEIDLVEHVGTNIGGIHSNIHSFSFNHRIGTNKGGYLYVQDATTAFHDYSLDYFTNDMLFKVDDQVIFQIERQSNWGWEEWPFDKAFHLILNIAMGGSWGGSVIDNFALPARMEIEYVRVFVPLEDSGLQP